MRARVLLAAAGWLLILGCGGSGGGTEAVKESKAIAPVPSTISPFRDAADETGLRFRHDPRLSGEFYLPEIMGSGAAVFDYDADGDLDVFLVQAGPGSGLFRNELVPEGRLRFTDVTRPAGIDFSGYGMGVAAGDYDNDGHVDLYITAFGSNALFHNNGDGAFRNVTRTSGTDDERWSASAMFFDYDRDGRLDLFVTNYVDFTQRSNKPCFSSARERDYCSPKAYSPVPDRLFKNLGGGRFADVSKESGILAAYGPGLGVTATDVNGDGFLDVYVANDGQQNQLWINRDGSRFEETGLISGSAVDANGRALAGMGVAAADFDMDGDDDIFVTNLTREINTLYQNSGEGNFEDLTERYRLGQPSFLFTGFGTQWFDYDNDGYLDLFVANGAVTIDESRRGRSDYPYEQRNQLYRNSGSAGPVRFNEVRGGAMDVLNVGRGAAFGDLDNDGDVDVVIANNKGAARLLLNEQKAGNHWLKIRLNAASWNRNGLGARVGIRRTVGSVLWRRAGTDGSYLSANSADVHVGLGASPGPVEVELHWLGGRKEVWRNVTTDQLLILKQGSGEDR